MFSLKKQLKARSSGFTIVELLIVIVVIGILATLVIVTFTGIQQKGRNSQRQTDLKAVQSHVAAYFADKGYYPSEKDMEDPTWVSANMKGLDAEALKDPKQSSGTIGHADPVAANQYSYVASGTGCDNTANSGDSNSGCDTYKLSAKQEGNGAADIVLQSN